MTAERQPPKRSHSETSKANISSGVKKILSTPEMSERLSKIRIAQWEENPQRRAEQSQIQTLLWQDPKHRDKMIKSRTGKRLSPKHKKNISIALSGKPSPLRGRTMSEEHKAKISLAKKETHKLKKQAQQIQESPQTIIEENIDLDLWKSAIEENLIGVILNQNLLTKEEIDRIKKDLEAGKKPSEKLMEKFSIAVARTA